MSPRTFVPDSFDVPRRLLGDGFVLEPLGPEHNASDHAAWGNSIDHIRATPGFTAADWGGDDWPFPMPIEQNLGDLQMHAGEFERREAFAYTVLELDGDGSGRNVIGCVYVDPDTEGMAEAMVRCWVRSDRAHLDEPLARAVHQWLVTCWPFASVRFPGRALAQA
jgi:hypothetical protein